MSCGCGCGGAGGCGPPLIASCAASGLAGLAGLGICTSGDCDTGAANVNQMDSVYQSADPNTQAQFQSAHDGIMATFNQIYSWYSDLIPFNPNCCAVDQLGTQAAQLTIQMQTAMGQAPVTAPPVSSSGLGSWILPIGIGLGLWLLLRK